MIKKAIYLYGYIEMYSYEHILIDIKPKKSHLSALLLKAIGLRRFLPMILLQLMVKH